MERAFQSILVKYSQYHWKQWRNTGAHISNLLLLVFLKCFPGLVESGKVFKAVPPLYGIPVGKKFKYFTERLDYIRYRQKEFYKKNEVTDAKGKKVDPNTFSRILMENSDYLYDFGEIMDTYKLTPELLEAIIISYLKKEKFETFRKRITSMYRFIGNDNIVKLKDSIKIKGLIGKEVETVYYNERFIQECSKIIPPIKKALSENHMEFFINGNKVGLYTMINSAMNIAEVSRFKGLGEMNGDQLAESTMNPDTRTLIQYTVDDINDTVNIIRNYDSNKKLIFTEIGNIDRGELIGI